jgi:hypothetical protein
MRLPISALALAWAASAVPAGPAAAQQIQAGGGSRCVDYGSFAVVDPPPPPRGAPIVARSIQPCADLPGSPQQPPLYIDAQVQIGGQGTAAGTGTGVGSGSGTGVGVGVGSGAGLSVGVGGVGGVGGVQGTWQRPADPSFGQGALQPVGPMGPPGGGFTSRVWRR